MRAQDSGTLPRLIAESREFVRQTWGQGEACVHFYAPLTRADGMAWVHPAWAREAAWRDITLRADRIWGISGSFWNPGLFRLIWRTQWPPAGAAGGEWEGGGQ